MIRRRNQLLFFKNCASYERDTNNNEKSIPLGDSGAQKAASCSRRGSSGDCYNIRSIEIDSKKDLQRRKLMSQYDCQRFLNGKDRMHE